MVINKVELYKFFSTVPVTDKHNGKTVTVLVSGNGISKVQDEHGTTFAAFNSELKRVKEESDGRW